MKKNRIYINMLIAMLMLSLLAIGCAPARRPVPETDRMQTGVPDDAARDRYTGLGPYDDPNNLRDEFNIGGVSPNQRPIVGTNDMTRNNNEIVAQNGNARNSRLETEVEKIDGVTDAIVIVNNNIAYVGVETDTGNNVLNTNGMQSEVARRIRSVMPSITRVYVTSEADRFTRLRDFTTRTRTTTGAWTRDMIDELEGIF